jgi:hypothetical protein
LSVGLGMFHGREPEINAEVGAEVSEYLGVELLAIIRDDDSRDSEATYDRFLRELLYVLGGDRGQGFHFDPLSEVVDC